MLATAATPALAGAPDDATPPVADGDEIVVTGRDANASIIGSDISVLRYPQSVRVLDRQELDAVNANGLGDVLDLRAACRGRTTWRPVGQVRHPGLCGR